MSVVDASFGHPLPIEERAAVPLMGGFMNYGYQCGMFWGTTLAAGAQAYRVLGPGPQAETAAIVAAQRIAQFFRTNYEDVNCFRITGIEFRAESKRRIMLQTGKFFLKGGPLRCLRMSAKAARVASGEIEATLAAKHPAPASPLSCAAVLAQHMGASDVHTLMAAGLAGGIGLSGSACGALGAAIWITGMHWLQEDAGDNGIWQSAVFQARAADVLARFKQCTGSQFECSKIVGRQFESIDDHAAHVRAGGCAEIIEALAA